MNEKDNLYKNLNQGILEERLRIFDRYLEKNLPLIKKHGGLKPLVSLIAKKRIVIIGAGPSLDEAIPVLKKFQKSRGTIFIATDMALKPLMKYGITPHFVFSCETNPVDYFGGVDTSRMHLVAFSCMSHSSLRTWKGNISFYNWMIDLPEYNFLWEKAGGNIGFLGTGGLVTTQAVSFALGCGAGSVAIAGNDLAFSDKYYAGASIRHEMMFRNYERVKNALSQEKNLIYKMREYDIVRDNETYFTNAQFLAAKYWLEDLFKKESFTVYDSSNPGCTGPFIKKISLKDFFNKI
jgi:hypothetical protein